MWKLISVSPFAVINTYVTFVLPPIYRIMTSTRLQDDLLKDFKEQKKMIYEQVELLDPLGTSLRKPAAQRLISKGFMIFSEVICYLLAAGIIAFMFFMDKIYPFYILADLRFKSEFRSMGWINIQAFVFAIYASSYPINSLLKLAVFTACTRLSLSCTLNTVVPRANNRKELVA